MKFFLPAVAAAAVLLLLLPPPAAPYPEIHVDRVDVYAETVSPEWHPVEEWSVRRENE